MRVRIAVLAAFAGLIAPLAAANAARLEKEACDGLKAEQGTLVAAGVRDKMQGGPEHAKAAFGPAVLEQITFRCDRPRIAALRPPAPTPPPGAEPAPAAGEEPAAESPAHPKPKKQKKETRDHQPNREKEEDEAIVAFSFIWWIYGLYWRRRLGADCIFYTNK